MMRLMLLFTLLLALGLFSCNNLAPAGFWNDFKGELLTASISDQGPYGGHRAMYWKAKRPGTLGVRDGITFAAKNGWELVDSIKIASGQSWTVGDASFLSADSTGSWIYGDELGNTSFPTWIHGEATTYKFKTGWLLFEPGTDNSTEVNGFVVVNKDGTEMAVYHLWGE